MENLNLAFNEKRLIQKALAKTKGNVTKAYELNVPDGFFMTYKTYLNKINNVYKLNKNEQKAIQRNGIKI